MITIEDQIKKDADKYQDIINSKYDKYWESMYQQPVKAEIGEKYMESYRHANSIGPHVLKLSREAIAYLYVKLFNDTANQAGGMSGDLAVGFAIYDPQSLPTPDHPESSDQDWDPQRANKNSIMLGYWDPQNGTPKGKGIRPFSVTINKGGAPVVVELYDDWSQEWP